MFDIHWHPDTRKFLWKQNKDIAKRIVSKIKSIKENPFHYLEHYGGKGYKLRIGDYRAIIDLDFEKKILFVRVLDKRGRIYKR
jgi:mRNA-degrading endonuclease RelE of RelBE toxin-antitoxin system